jgi:hypothetical protein
MGRNIMDLMGEDDGMEICGWIHWERLGMGPLRDWGWDIGQVPSNIIKEEQKEWADRVV